MPAVIVVGGGGHARVVIDALRMAGRAVLGVVDPQPAVAATLPAGVPLLGGDEVLERRDRGDIVLANGIGAVGRPRLRRTVFERWRAAGFDFVTVVHPSAVIAAEVAVERGAQIMAGAILQPGCVVGENTIVNTRASIDHDCRIGSHCHIAPGTVLSGTVSVGDETFVGAGATVIHNIRIGKHVVVAAGTIVFKNIPDGVIVRNSVGIKMITVAE